MNSTAARLFSDIKKELETSGDKISQSAETAILEYLADKFVNIWCIEDIVFRALEREIGLAYFEVATILDSLEAQDGGMSWYVIDAYIDRAVEDRENSMDYDSMEFYEKNQKAINDYLIDGLAKGYGANSYAKNSSTPKEIIVFVQSDFSTSEN